MKRDEIMDFLHAIDLEMAQHAKEGEVLELYLIGRSALIVRYGLNLATKDVDIVHRYGCALETKAVEVFGRGSPNAERLGFFLEEVPEGLPPIPGGYRLRSEDIPGEWRTIRPKQPEPHDLAVTKLSRFHAKDREDLQILCDSGHLIAEKLQRSLDSAFAFAADEDEDPQRKRAYANFRVLIAYLEGKRRQL